LFFLTFSARSIASLARDYLVYSYSPLLSMVLTSIVTVLYYPVGWGSLQSGYIVVVG
jgi:hypothetical protein